MEAVLDIINSEVQSEDQYESQLIMHLQNINSHMNTEANK